MTDRMTALEQQVWHAAYGAAFAADADKYGYADSDKEAAVWAYRAKRPAAVADQAVYALREYRAKHGSDVGVLLRVKEVERNG